MTKIWRTIILFFILWAGGSDSFCQTKTVHAFYFIYANNDTINAAKSDSVEARKENCTRNLDLLRAKKTVSEIGEKFGYTVLHKVYSGELCSKECVYDCLESLHCEDSDIVVFYYSGHGISVMDKKDSLPVMTMKYHNNPMDIKKNAVPVNAIVNRLRLSGAHLNFVISDCCNDNCWAGNRNGVYIEDKSSNKNDHKNSHRLVVAITAANKGASTYYDIPSDEKYERINDSIMNDVKSDNYSRVGQYDDFTASWFTYGLYKDMRYCLVLKEGDTWFSLNNLMNRIKKKLDQFVDGYNYTKKVESFEKFKPSYRITFF